MTADVTTDRGYYAAVPEWLLDSGVSGNAVKLYAILLRYADQASKFAHPSRKTLATRMGFARPQTIDPIVQELVDASALTIVARWTRDGDRDSNGYHVHWHTPPTAQGGTPERTTGGAVERMTVAPETAQEPKPGNHSHGNQEISSEAPNDDPKALAVAAYEAWPKRVNRKASIDVFLRAAKKHDAVGLYQNVLIFAEAYREHVERQFTPALDVWLRGERWTDDLPQAPEARRAPTEDRKVAQGRAVHEELLRRQQQEAHRAELEQADYDADPLGLSDLGRMP